MPTAVRTLNLPDGPSEIRDLEGYNHCLLLVRLRGRPIGQLRLAVSDGRIDDSELWAAILGELGWALCEDLVRTEYLGQAPAPVSISGRVSTTVAVCTRDRTEDLRRCLATLSTLPDDGQELLIVDNCPTTDDTRQLVADYPRLRYLREDHPGAGAARNRALREARGDVVAFTDDDAAPDPGWLRGLVGNFDDPLVGCVTGLTMPLELESEVQEAFERYSPFGRGFTRRVFDPREFNPVLAGLAGASVNAALRRSVALEIGGFDEALGPGTPARSGEDTDIFTRIMAAGYRIVFDPAALCWPRHRRTWEDLRDNLYGYGAGVYGAWTRAMVFEHEWTVPLHAWGWFRHHHLRQLYRAVRRRPNAAPTSLILAELRGCLDGPWAYLARRRHLERAGHVRRN